MKKNLSLLPAQQEILVFNNGFAKMSDFIFVHEGI